MDDAVIQEQLQQIFPQEEQAFLQRTIEEAKSNQNADILTQCIEIVLDRQAALRIATNDRQDDVIVVEASKNKDLNKTGGIPVVYVGEDRSFVINKPVPRHQLTIDSDSQESFDSESSDDDRINERWNDYGYRYYGGNDLTIRDIKNKQPLPTHIHQQMPAQPPSHWTSFETPPHFSTITRLPGTAPPAMNSQQVPTAVLRHAASISFTTTIQPSTVTRPPLESAPLNLQTSLIAGMSLLDSVRQMFPNVNTDFVKSLSHQGYDLNGIVNQLLERKDMQNSGTNKTQSSPKEQTQTKDVDYFKEYSKPVSRQYSDQCLCLLKNEFRRVAVVDIKRAVDICNGHYAPSRKLIEEALLAMYRDGNYQSPAPTSNSGKPKKFVIARLIASKRPPVYVSSVLDSELQLEIDFVKAQAMLAEEKKDAIYAALLNEEQYKSEGQLIECGCCFGEFPFEEIVQCSDAHLFCKECLHGYAKEVIFGSAIASVTLTCMADGCDNKFMYDQLEKCLSKNEIEKYQGRLQEDCLAKAKTDIPNLYQCPFCEFAAIVPEEEKVFSCMNSSCNKVSCKECKEEWKDHFGLKCNEVEKRSQANLRLSYEERMTLAKVRKCAKCSLTFTKSDGCNKMTCRCGATQCYVCRKPYINYQHFCRHPRDPGMKCSKCAQCSLWTDPTEDDDLAIKQLGDEANAAKRKLDEELAIEAKKQKV